MNILNRPAIHYCKTQYLQIQSASIATLRTWCVRGHIVLPAVFRFLWGGVKTHVRLTRKLGAPWLSRNFPDLQPKQLFQSACQLVPLIWKENTADDIADADRLSRQILPMQLKRIQRQIRQLPQVDVELRSDASRRLMQAAFARSVAAVMGQVLPQNLVQTLRADRSLRDLMLTWIDLVLITTARPDSRNLLSSLAVHSTLTLPAGDRIPVNLRHRLGSVRRELNSELREAKRHWQTESLKRRIQLSSSRILALPMAFADAMTERQNSVH